MPVKDGPWQFAHAGISRVGSPLVASDSPRARIALLTTGVAGGGKGGCSEAK
jgi:hypothetical protein